HLRVSAAVAVLIGGTAHAQNLDQGKPAARLFADSCATCHHRAMGLAKGRLHLGLFLFLQQHYTTDTGSAWALTSYLESVDSAPPTAAAKPPARVSPAAPRPPAATAGR